MNRNKKNEEEKFRLKEMKFLKKKQNKAKEMKNNQEAEAPQEWRKIYQMKELKGKKKLQKRKER